MPPWSESCTWATCRYDDRLSYTWIMLKYVGLSVASEAAATYYRLISPVINNLQLQEVGNFLRKDHFHLGIVPADHLHRLHLHLFNSQTYTPKGLLMLAECRRSEANYLTQYIHALLRVKMRDRFQLTVSATWHNFIRPSSDALARVLVPVLKELRDAGITVTVQVWNARDTKAYDMSQSLDIPQEDWCASWDEKMREERRVG
ncbi:hypothetical protein CC86DRAFT_411936 [Ophiobolus disseminans]|uniref:Uncharacterized protein n=1 Tax=Ophiobolus disseminans TaxID=1469910 RepID=A0A6A6ZJY3_9PLEO|nr:hypothetical protein CC86DRAFT_411936 [Ophiobolus disseminans]